MIQPIIKWSGSKRPIMPELSVQFPRKYNTYIDPFVGGGSSLPYSKTWFLAGDNMTSLVKLWVTIKNDSNRLKNYYRHLWNNLQEQGDKVYYDVRSRFNRYGDPLDLFFLTRTCYSGLIRFNASGEFNTSFHFGRKGMSPDKIDKVIDQWIPIVSRGGFFSGDYIETLSLARSGDFVFLDPPYVGSKQYDLNSRKFDYNRLTMALEDLNNRGVYWMLTLGGSDDNPITSDIYQRIFFTSQKSSSLGRMSKSNIRSNDIVYMNYSEKIC